jgi:cellulose synthase operon protein YhjQ
MTDRNAPFDEIPAPEDAATSYSWANLHGVKYREFSASRAQARDRMRQMAHEAADTGRQPSEFVHSAPNDQNPAQVVQPDAERSHLEEVIRALRDAQLTSRPAVEGQAAPDSQTAQIAAPQQPLSEQDSLPSPEASEPHFAAQSADDAAPGTPLPPSSLSRLPLGPALTSGPEDANSRWLRNPIQTPRDPWPRTGLWQNPLENQLEGAQENQRESQREETRRETGARPAWLADERIVSQAAAPKSSDDTLQGSRGRLASRWFALKTLFEAADATAEPAPAPSPITMRAPVLAVFSLAGGVGKTSLVATLGRALSARGERVLLVDTAAFGLLPFFFGARDQRMGVLRTFSPPAVLGDAPVQMITLDPESLDEETCGPETLTGEIAKCAQGVSRVIVDLATASGTLTRQLLRMHPLVLVPVVPDMNSVVSVSSIDAFFERAAGAAGASLPYYVLNQFDFSLPLHLDVREILLEQLGDRLLSFALRRTPAVSEALAEGMTVIDYAPNSTVAEDFSSLAGWLKSLSAPATGGYRGVRWSER